MNSSYTNNKPRIVFVTRGGTEMGMGHVSRSITVAESMVNKANISFVAASPDEIVINFINKAGFNVLETNNDAETRFYLNNLKPAVIILDKSNIEESFAKELRSTLNSKLVLFENNSNANSFASMVVNAVKGTCFKNVKYYNKSTNTLYFCGPKYWILRKEFYEYKKKKKTINPHPKKITLTFGGSDPANYSLKVLIELLNWERDLQIDLCLGVHYMYSGELNAALNKYRPKSKNVAIHINSQNLAELMYGADLVITSPGTSAVEALSIGTPIIAITQNANQDRAFRGYLNTINEDKVTDIRNMVDSSDFIYPYQKEIIEAQIGEGKEEVLQTIMKLAERG